MSRVIEAVKDDIIAADDGYYVYCPSEGRGFLTEQHLREIADHLAEKNKEWDQKVKEMCDD